MQRLGRVHTTRRASTISAKHRKAEKTTSSFSKREKIRRKPFKRRNSRSISLRFLYSSRSYPRGEADWTSAAPPESCPSPALTDACHRLQRRDPSRAEAPPA